MGFGPAELPYDVIASTSLWRLRDYGGGEPGRSPLLIVAAPIKRPYLWDLTPRASAVRTCLAKGFRVFLLEWVPPSAAGAVAGLEDYAGRAIGECVAVLAREHGAATPLLVGHSLGGTFAAIFAAAQPQSVRGLVLLSAPLDFERATCRFSDAVAERGPERVRGASVVPGSGLSGFCAAASPGIFVWSRYEDAAKCLLDPAAMDTHLRIERWALDEVALPGRLIHQVLQWLYRENRFFRGTLAIGDKLVGPGNVVNPVLAVVTPADDVAPIESVSPFLAAMPTDDVRLLTYPGEVGVGLQHLGILAGREAYRRIWPQITAWIEAHC